MKKASTKKLSCKKVIAKTHWNSKGRDSSEVIAEKVKVCEEFLAGRITKSELAKKYGAQYCTIYNWINKYQKFGAEGFKSKRTKW